MVNNNADSVQWKILLLLLLLQMSPAEAKTLKDHKISPVYSEQEAENNTIGVDENHASFLSTEKINSSFSNVSDLAWLEGIAENKVILIGETHYSDEIEHLKDRMIFKLNQIDYFPLVITENSYSISQFFNHYVHIKNNEDAESFLRELKKFIKYENELNFINGIRNWNLKFPNKTISLGSTDLEWDYPNMCKNIIKPYFEKLEQIENHNFDQITEHCNGQENEFFKKIKPLLDLASEENLVGEYPFITADYISNVIENFSDTNNALRYGFEYYRQSSIIKKITSDDYFGSYFKDQKVIIYGGGNHTKSKFNYPDGGNFLSEGSYLNHSFSPTKNKVYSIMLKGLSFSLGSNKEISIDGLQLGQQYRKIFNQLTKAYQAGLLLPDKYYFLYGERSEFEKFIFEKSYKNKLSAVMLSESSESILSTLTEREANESNDYNQVIYFPFTTLEKIKIHH